MPEKNLEILLSLNDRATGALKKADKEITGFTKKFKANWVGITASVTAAVVAIDKAYNVAKFSAKAKQQGEAFKNLAQSVGADSKQIVSDLKKMSGDTISSLEAMDSASKALVLGLGPDQLPRLMEISRAAARAFGQDVNFMFDSITLGIGRQSKMILDNLGIIVSAETAYENYAKTVGKSANELTDLEKRQAFANEVMRQGTQIINAVNISGKSQLEVFQSLEAAVEDLKIKFGDFFLAVVQGMGVFSNVIVSGFISTFEWAENVKIRLFEVTRSVIEFSNTVLDKIPGVQEPYQGLIEKFDQMIERSQMLKIGYSETADEMAVKAEEIKRIMFDSNEQLSLNTQRIMEASKAAKEQVEESEDSLKGLKSTMKSSGDSIANSFGQMIVHGKDFTSSMIGAFKSMAAAFIAEVTKMIAKWLVFAALKSATGGGFGIFAQGGQVGPSGNNLAIPRAAQGAMIGNSVGRAVPVIAHEGEVIGTPQRLAESGIGGSNITINIYEPSMQSGSDIGELAEQLGFETERAIRSQRGF